MKKISITLIIALSIIVTVNVSAAVNPCVVNPELCPEAPPVPPTPPETCNDDKKKAANIQEVTMHGMPLPRASSLTNIEAVLNALKADLPSMHIVKSIAAQPDSYNGVFNVIDSANCIYSYNVTTEDSGLGNEEIKTATLKSNSCGN